MRNLLEKDNIKPARGGVKLPPLSSRFPYRRSPASGPHGASYEGAPRQDLRNPYSTTSWLTVSQSGAFSDCVTRFRGGALRHAKFPKTSYKVQLLDTLKHAACVSLNHRRRRGLIFLSGKVLVPSWAKRRRFVGLPLHRRAKLPRGKPTRAEIPCGCGAVERRRMTEPFREISRVRRRQFGFGKSHTKKRRRVREQAVRRGRIGFCEKILDTTKESPAVAGLFTSETDENENRREKGNQRDERSADKL